jgi:hypothetical protein
MAKNQSVGDTIKEFWEIEEELWSVDPSSIISRLPHGLLPVEKYLAPFRLTENQVIYRARPVGANYMQNGGREEIANYTYAPKEFTPLGRANFPGKPMFYGSEYISATAFEARSGMERKSLVGCWRVKKGSPVAKFAICACLFRPEINFDHAKTLSEPLLSKVKFLDEIFSVDRKRRIWTETRRGIKERKESPKDSIHVITSAIADFLIEREGVDGVLYHSAQALGAKAVFPSRDPLNRLFNIAIRPEYVDQHMELERVYRVKIDTYTDEEGRKRATRSAVEIGLPIDDSNLEFSELNQDQVRDFEVEHNCSDVPMLLEGHIELTIPNPKDADGCKILVDSFKCKTHQTGPELRRTTVDGLPTIVIGVCCEELSGLLVDALREAGHWND